MPAPRRLSLIPEEGISKEHGQGRNPFVTWQFTPFLPAVKEEIKLSNACPGPDWSVEWIFSSLISATANRQSSKGSRENRGGRGVRRL